MQKIVFIVPLIITIIVQTAKIEAEELSKQDVEYIFQSTIKPTILENLRPKYSSCTDTQILSIENSYQQCLENICGKSDKFKNYTEYLDDFVKTSASAFDNIPQDFKAKFNEVALKQHRYQKDMLTKLKHLIQSDDLEILPALRPIYNYSFIFAFIDLLSFNEDMTINGFDETILTKYPYSLTAVEKKWILESFNEVDMWKDFSSITASPSNYLLKKYPGMNLEEAVSKDAQQIRNQLEEFKKNNPDIMESFPGMLNLIAGLPLIDKVIGNDELLMDEVEEFVGAIVFIERFLSICGSPEKYPILNSNKNINLKNISERFQVSKKLEDKLSDLSISDNLNNRIEEVTEKCYASFLMKEVVPTKTENDEFQKKIINYKQDFKINAIPNYSQISKSKIELIIDKLNFSLPKDKESYSNYLNKEINEAIKIYKDGVEDYFTATKQTQKQMVLLNIFDFMELDDPGEILSLIESSCEHEGISSHLSDATNTVSGKIYVSWQSMKLPLGKGVIFHEIAHNVYQAFQNQQLTKKSFGKFQKITDCLNTTHPEVADDSFIEQIIQLNDKSQGTYKEGLYTEEDFADMLSAKASVENNQHFTCHFIYQNKYEHNKSTINRYDYSTLENEYDDDPHSSDFYRVLNLEFLKNGDIPSTCKDYLKQTGTIFPIRNCN